MAQRYTFQFDDFALLRVASYLGQKAGKSAATACETAECTVGASEALELVGYSEENLLRIEKREGADIELPTKARLALNTGLRLYATKLEKLKESEGGLLVDAYDTDQKMANVARCLRLLNGYDVPELPLDSETTVSVNGGPRVPLDLLSKAIDQNLSDIDRRRASRKSRDTEPVG